MNRQIEEEYQIISAVNLGGSCRMYVAEHRQERTRWAVKEIKKTPGGQDPLYTLKMLRGMKDPVMPAIREIYDDGDVLSTVEEYIPGVNLCAYVEQSGVMDEDDVVGWMIKLTGFLHKLHSLPDAPKLGDLEPEDLSLMPDNSIRITDYSAVCGLRPRIADEGYGFSAPEQRNGGITGAYTDIYTLGAIAYYALTGKEPDDKPYRFYPLRKLNPKASAGIEYILNKCLQQNARNRYQSAAELLYDLQNISRFDKVLRRFKFRRALRIASVLLVLAAAGALMIYGRITETREKKEDYRVLVNNAAALAAQGDYELAYERLDEARELIPDDQRSYEQWAELLYEEGDYTKCADYCSKQLAVFPESRSLALTLAMSDYAMGEYLVASEYFRLAGTEEMSLDQLRAYVISLLRLNRTSEARTLYNGFSNRWDYATSYYIEGELFASEGDYARAAASLSGAMTSASDDSMYLDSVLLLAEVYSEAALQEDSGIEDPSGSALALLSEAVTEERFADDARLLSAYAKAVAAAEAGGEERSKAARGLERAIELGENSEENYLLLCALLSEDGDHEKALDYAFRAESDYPDSWRVRARAAWEEIVMQSYLETDDRDYSAAYGEYQMAETLLAGGESDELMETLRAKIGELQDIGLISN